MSNKKDKNIEVYYCIACSGYVKNSMPFSNKGRYIQHINGTAHITTINNLKNSGISNNDINKLVYSRLYCGDIGFVDAGIEIEDEPEGLKNI